MSKINQIQKELQSLGDAKFQKLADAYLHQLLIRGDRLLLHILTTY